MDTKTQGQELLCAVQGSVRDLAARAAVSRSALASYRTGARLPSPEVARRLEAALGVPADAWGTVPGAESAAPTAAAPGPAAPVARRQVELHDVEQLPALAALDELIEAAREAQRDPGATRSEKGKAASELRALITARARVVRQAALDTAITLDRIARHPIWAKMCNCILDALEQHPAALMAVRDALHTLQAEEAAKKEAP